MLLLFVIIAFFATFVSSQHPPCWTPRGTRGSCINLKQCDPLMKILRSPGPLHPQDRNTLSRSQCGFDGITPMVCCPNNSEAESIVGRAVLPNAADHPNLRLLDNDRCGLATQPRIYGGNKTSVLEFPWMAMLGYEMDGTKDVVFNCGGSVITKRYILTAAHCVTGLHLGSSLSKVRVGEHDLDKEIDCDYNTRGVPTNCADKYQDLSIERFHFYDQYKTEKRGVDIALIRVDRDIDFERNNVKPICLPIGKAATLKFDKGIVTGWGVTETGMKSRTLLKVTLPIVQNDKCGSAYKDGVLPYDNPKVEISESQFCAGGENGKDSCTGDSGGLFQVPDGSNGSPRYVQYGVVSFGPNPCGTAGIPGVYTKVAYFVDWILDTIKE